MGFLTYITFIGIALADIGAVLLGGLAYIDFKNRGLSRQANGARSGILLLFFGFIIAAGAYVWPIGEWKAVTALIIIFGIIIGLVLWIIALLFRRSKGP